MQLQSLMRDDETANAREKKQKTDRNIYLVLQHLWGDMRAGNASHHMPGGWVNIQCFLLDVAMLLWQIIFISSCPNSPPLALSPDKCDTGVILRRPRGTPLGFGGAMAYRFYSSASWNVVQTQNRIF